MGHSPRPDSRARFTESVADDARHRPDHPGALLGGIADFVGRGLRAAAGGRGGSGRRHRHLDGAAGSAAGAGAYAMRWAACLAVGLLSGCTADIRPEAMVAGPPDVGAQERGAALMSRAVSAHGGRDHWLAAGPTAYTVHDVWQGLVGRLFNPWPEHDLRVRIVSTPGTDVVRALFLDGEARCERWSFAGGRAEPDDDDPGFILPTMQYLLELPFRVAEAPIVVDAGAVDVRGRRYERVLATWGALEPHADADQWLLFLDAETGRLAMAHFTVRSVTRGATGTVLYGAFRDQDGITLAHELTLTTADPADGEQDILHRVTVEAIVRGPHAAGADRCPRSPASG
mgnify:CR=1 FL=1